MRIFIRMCVSVHTVLTNPCRCQRCSVLYKTVTSGLRRENLWWDETPLRNSHLPAGPLLYDEATNTHTFKTISNIYIWGQKSDHISLKIKTGRWRNYIWSLCSNAKMLLFLSYIFNRKKYPGNIVCIDWSLLSIIRFSLRTLTLAQDFSPIVTFSGEVTLRDKPNKRIASIS